jgi:hypothetical protein
MTVKRVEYVCDICGDVVRKERMGPDIRPFIGFELGLMGDHHKAKSRFVLKHPGDSERHLCHCCLSGLVSLARRALPAETVKDAIGTD